MDILYNLGQGSKWEDNELRYSLRSIAAYGKNVGRVYIVGKDPGFLSDEVTLIPFKERFDNHTKNIIDGICYAVDHSDIGEEFLSSADDHFYIKDTDFENYPYYHRGELMKDVRYDDPFYNYHKCLESTRNLLERHGYPCYHFAFHGNTHCSRTAVELARDIIEESFTLEHGGEHTALVLNVLLHHNPFPMVHRRDYKLRGPRSIDYLKETIGSREVFSTDVDIHPTIKQYLSQLFPNKCKYEN